LTQFLGAFNDNLFKSALVILITFNLAEEYGLNAQVLITLVAGIFILPFFLFSATAGQISDKYEKSFLIKIVKLVEIILMILTGIAFQGTHLYLLIFLLFMMGAQSTFFGPLKYSILPQHLEESELVAGNGLVNAGTYIAILTGTIFGGLLILGESGRAVISAGIICVAVAGFISSFFIPKAEAPAPDMKVDWNIPRATKRMISFVMPERAVFNALLGKSWFWLLGSVFLAQFPTFAKDALGGNEQVSTFFMVVFSVGVGVGSTLCNKLLKGAVSARLIPYGGVGISLSAALLYIFTLFVRESGSLAGLGEFMTRGTSWGITLSLFLLSVFGGIYSVPLYAIVQARSPEKHKARIIACGNLTDSLGMVLSAAIVAFLLTVKISIAHIFLIIAVINLAITPIIAKAAGDGI
jgi:MFS family permease